ncbi:MAG: hypothetical protein WBA17_11770 [Saprospiraceae bacterium]
MTHVQILVDNPASWMVPHARRLVDELTRAGHAAKLLHEHEAVEQGDILCLLSCEKLFKRLELNRHNLVVHSSDLPRGKGWSPLTWQILEGKNDIPMTLFEAAAEVDAGVVYNRAVLTFNGTELLPEMTRLQGEKIVEIILRFVAAYPRVNGKPQEGESTFYPRRRPADSRLDPERSLAEQFNLLRVCDNERYPAFFDFRGERYTIRIERG